MNHAPVVRSPSAVMKDAYVHVTKIKKWDICAGDAILRALGGKLTDLDGKEVDYRDVKLQYMPPLS